MNSTIDPSAPANDAALLSNAVRANFAAAKSDIDGLLTTVAAIPAQITAAAGGVTPFATLAAMNADLTHSGFAQVYADSTPANNRQYYRANTGASWASAPNQTDIETTRATSSEDQNALRTILNERAVGMTRIGADSDSITKNNMLADVSGSFISTSSLGILINALSGWPYGECDCWNNTANSPNFYDGMIEAVAGSRTTDVIGRLNTDLNYAPRIQYLADGINDLIDNQTSGGTAPTVATILNNMAIENLAFTSRGIQVIRSTVLPVTSAVLTSTTNWGLVNTGIKAMAGPGVTIFDGASILDDGTGRPKSGTVDSGGLHPTTLGAQMVGFGGSSSPYNVAPLQTLLQQMIKACPLRMPPDSQNLIINPRFTARTGGTAGANIVGGSTIPAGWTAGMISGSPHATVAISTAAFAETNGYETILDFTTNGAGSNGEVFQFKQTAAIDLTPYVGQWISLRFKLQVINTSLIFRAIQALGSPYIECNRPRDAANPQLDVYVTPMNRFWHQRGMPFKVPSSPAAFAPQVEVVIDASTSTTGRIIVCLAEVIVVDDPLRAHGVTT